eukprot:TRINITY_DN2945_c0_g1_i7.p1 TRINITY_DN2945_c0_g1~~TRINITY_DN2945_c0_g1_i7.p1  ORF type:complete len:368 (-),score=82.38 TRINITY_DN2945_c0_g1_i7:1709-2788(-)
MRLRWPLPPGVLTQSSSQPRRILPHRRQRLPRNSRHSLFISDLSLRPSFGQKNANQQNTKTHKTQNTTAMAQPESRRIQVEFIDEPELVALCSACRSVVHFKGFGPGMDVQAEPAAPEMLALLAAADVVVFDGDPWDATSFTSALRVLLDEHLPHGQPPPRLVAFKYAAQQHDFARDWQDFAVRQAPDAQIKIHCVLVPNEVARQPELFDAEAARAAAAASGVKHEHPLHPQTPLDEGRLVFVALGTFAIKTMQRAVPAARRQVVVWGGMHSVHREFSVNTALGDSLVWRYFHARRGTSEGMLRQVQHPLLAHHQYHTNSATTETPPCVCVFACLCVCVCCLARPQSELAGGNSSSDGS